MVRKQARFNMLADVPLDATADYYSHLGALPSLDHDVISVLYHSLENRHVRDSEKAKALVAAYKVASNDKLRSKYDQMRGNCEGGLGQYEVRQEADRAVAFAPPEDEAWRSAIEYYPELTSRISRLRFLSESLALAFRVKITNAKLYNEADQIEKQLVNEFLEYYFGKTPEVKAFARWCIETHRNHIASEINRVVRSLGPTIDGRRVVDKLKSQYGLGRNFWNFTTPNELILLLVGYLVFRIWYLVEGTHDVLLINFVEIASGLWFILFLYKIVVWIRKRKV